MTSVWAHRYGLPDPGVPAGAVRNADDHGLDAAATRLSSAMLAFAFGGDRGRGAAAGLRDGWSTPHARHSVAELTGSSDALSDRCREMARGIAALREELAGAAAAVERAYRVADVTIAEEGLTAEPLTATALEMQHRRARRCSVVTETHVATSSALDRLQDAASATIRAFDRDPRDLLPRGVDAGAVGDDVDGVRYPAEGATLVPVRAQCTVPSATEVDAARRSALMSDRFAPESRRRLFAHAVQRALDEAAAVGGVAQLVTYDPDGNGGQGAAAIAVGDIGLADTVSVLVPGVGNSPMDMLGTVHVAADLAAATARSGGPGARSAAVVWFGYDIPLSWTADRPPARGHDPLAAVLGDSALALDATAALPAAAGLGAFTRAVRSMMTPSAGLTLVGHSYGSTVVSQAARNLDREAGVDDIVLMGSPGAGYRLATAGDYAAVPAEHVYTLAFPADPIPMLVTDLVAGALNPLGALPRGIVLGTSGGPFGVDPHAPRFGSQVIVVPSGTSWNGGIDLAQHALDNYLSGPALDAVAAVAAGRYASVPVRHAG